MKAHIREDAAAAFRQADIKPFCKGQRVIPKTYLEYEKLLKRWAGHTLEVREQYGSERGNTRYVLSYPEPLEDKRVIGIDVPSYLIDYLGD